ncbi:YwmB family TATA-box binding protein [Paenibacillus sp. J2TS4]|uniref:YwmB family TATA-box binding protein n=1 Tax=Paenibacillus sp. J2TS4 TaxID=2807194 RepID=UPI001B0B19E9|nr:YwmB family TATA-box binding protein [Paenibacillus sp. J2TS4]GIP34134.1 hypothetical protein J2TS4_33440 [Paenibacillus sp. J2TS4]
MNKNAPVSISVGRVAMIVVILVAVMGWNQFRAVADAGQTEKGWSELLRLADTLYDEAKLVIYQEQPYLAFEDISHFESLGRDLARQLELPAGHLKQSSDGRPSYDTRAPGYGGMVLMRLAALDDGQTSYLTIRWEGSLEEARLAQEWQERVTHAQPGEDHKAGWRINIQGGMNSTWKELADKEAVIEYIQEELKASRVDRYEDSGSLSVSLTSPLLQEYVLSGSDPIHAQAAVHRVTETGAWRLTLGSPMITTEY